jgi:phosphoribosylformylglycinamidine synthase II
MAIHEIRVTQIGDDPVGREVQHEAARAVGVEGLDEVRTAKIYRLEGVSEEEARHLAQTVLADPVSERFTVSEATNFNTEHVREVGYKPGVMNPEAQSIKKAAEDRGIHPVATDSSVEYAFFGKVTDKQVDNVVGQLLVNKTVAHVIAEKPDTLVFSGEVGPVTTVAVQEASDKELLELSKDKLFLNLDEMKAVQKHFRKLGRDPSDAELEIIAAAWSEHCGHKTFNAAIELADGSIKAPLFKRIKETARRHFGDKILSAFDDNSGVMKFADGQAICGKVETHNSPSAIEPYGGAMTGSGGVFRDILGTAKGAKNVISTDMFCLAPPDLDPATLPPGTLAPDYLQRRVVQGVRDYGNRMGIPTGNGSLHFHEDFRAKPTVIVGAYGIMPEEHAAKGVPQVGDLVVAVGGRTGRDGIHGATFSSGEMTDRTAQVNSSAVQIGNAIEEKRMSDAIIEARDQGCIRALTDCGAAGFSSAIGEMGEEIGVTVDLSKAPLKYEGLAPWEIFLSESQERMVLAVPADKIDELNAICELYNVEASTLGLFDGSHTLTVNYGEQNVAELDYDFLKHGLPDRIMKANWQPEEIETIVPSTPETPAEWIDRLYAVMAHGNVASKEAIVRQYDHGVQGGTIVGPYGGKTEEGPNDALVIRPILGKPYGLVQSHGMNPILTRLNPYEGSKWAIAEAMANYVAVGGDPTEAALINNFIWPFPDEQEMGSLDQSVDAITEMMDVLGIPVISGKDSLSSTYRGKDGTVIKIPPVLCMSAFGRIPDVEGTITSALKKPGQTSLYLVGKPSQAMGGSTYYDVTGGQTNRIPQVDSQQLPITLKDMHLAIQTGNVNACHDISEGGLVTAVAEMCFGGQAGAQLVVPKDQATDSFLFSETAGCFVVELDADTSPVDLFPNTPWVHIGDTKAEDELSVFHTDDVGQENRNSEKIFDVSVNDLKKAWQAPTKELFS